MLDVVRILNVPNKNPCWIAYSSELEYLLTTLIQVIGPTQKSASFVTSRRPQRERCSSLACFLLNLGGRMSVFRYYGICLRVYINAPC
jgi:hypothetical protein